MSGPNNYNKGPNQKESEPAKGPMTKEQSKELSQLFESGVRDYIGYLHPLELAKNHSRGTPEFEIRFGTDANTKYTKVDYDSVVREIKKQGWHAEENIRGTLLLRITTESVDNSNNYTDSINDESELFGGARNQKQPYRHAPASSTRTYQMANIRAELVGDNQVEAYCKTNDLEKVYAQIPGASKVIKFTQKNFPDRKIGPMVNGKETPNISFSDFNFRVSSQYEKEFGMMDSNPQIRTIVNRWTTLHKHFRCMNRVRFRHPDSLVMVDVSIVKSNRTYTDPRTKKAIPIPALTTAESGVFTNPESYEIELELDNERVTKILADGTVPVDDLHAKIMKQLRGAIRMILSGLQETNYPIPYPEQTAILNEYMRCLCGEKWERGQTNPETREPYPAPYFCGYSSVTLQLEHTIGGSPMLPVQTGGSFGERSYSPVELQPGGTNLDIDQSGGAPVKKAAAVAKNTGGQISIGMDYCVTEKADGARALLYVSNSGKLYMINSNLKVIFTGAQTDDKKCHRTILDGEYIAYNAKHEMISLYAVFDVYVFGSMPTTNLRALPFGRADIPPELEDRYRLSIMNRVVSMLRPKSVLADTMVTKGCGFEIRAKQFYFGPAVEDAQTDDKSIFEQSAEIWRRQSRFEYEIDGLIFTPANLGVGGSKPLPTLDAVDKKMEDSKTQNPYYFAQAKKFTWDRSFKWKPPQFNTIDFLVRTIKSGKTSDKVFTTRMENGQIVQYKRLILHCGFDENRDRLANPVYNMLHDAKSMTLTATEEAQSSAIHPASKYRPTPFIPATPYDHSAQYCNIPIRAGDTFMRTTTDEVFSDEMIVEFKYDNSQSKATNPTEAGAWNWVPIRVRYDKTSRLRAGNAEYGNSYGVANDNWKSIHFPVSESIICGEEAADSRLVEEQIYYNRAQTDAGNETQAMRHFHNLFVKSELIRRVATYVNTVNGRRPTLIDYAVGKAGDLPKWKTANIDFVFGVDIAKDNILNNYDGAISRYLSNRAQNVRDPFRAIFVHGNSGLNIRTTGQAFYTDQDKQVATAIFGDGPKENQRQVADKFARIGHDGFDISSIQFAFHYMWQDSRKLHNFLRNLAECTKLNGYFIGTCYNGMNVMNLLRGTPYNGSVVYTKNGKKIFEVVKKYSEDLDNQTPVQFGVGVAIEVYQESIDNLIREYLVNFEYLEALLREYGFVPMPQAECTAAGFESHRMSFRRLFAECKRNNKGTGNNRAGNSTAGKMDMTQEEQNISFLNEIFIYKKTVQISPADMKSLSKRYGADSEPVDSSPGSKSNALNTETFARKLNGHYIVINANASTNYRPTSSEKEQVQVQPQSVPAHLNPQKMQTPLYQLVVKIFRNGERKTQDAIYRQMVSDTNAGSIKDPPLEWWYGKILAIFNILASDFNLMKSIRTTAPDRQDWITTQIADYLKARFPNILQPDKVIVDIGGGEGNVISGLGQRGKIPKKQLICVEQSQEDSTWATTYKHTHANTITYREWSNAQIMAKNAIPLLPPDTVDLVLFMVVLHHMPPEVGQSVLRQAFRALKSGGVVMVKEHDMNGPELLRAVHWEHHLYHLSEYLQEYATKKTGQESANRDLRDYLENHYAAYYRDKKAWNQLFTDVGFTLVEERTRTMGKVVGTDAKNTTNLYWQIWQKP